RWWRRSSHSASIESDMNRLYQQPETKERRETHAKAVGAGGGGSGLRNHPAFATNPKHNNSGTIICARCFAFGSVHSQAFYSRETQRQF
ncbi:MAG: hypothetical protein ACREMA_06305, partial [Longimicrobiales bacterium]